MRKELYALAKKNGICTRCGSRKAEEGKSACRLCLDYIKNKQEGYRLKKNPNTWKARAIRAEPNSERIEEVRKLINQEVKTIGKLTNIVPSDSEEIVKLKMKMSDSGTALDLGFKEIMDELTGERDE